MPMVLEGVTLTDDVVEVIAFLQDCLDKLERGEEDLILGSPFYERPDGKPPMTDEQVDKIVEAIDAEFAFEMGTYPGYHRNRSGAETTPDFFRLSPNARRAMVEGLECILTRHKELAKAAASPPPTPPPGSTEAPEYTG